MIGRGTFYTINSSFILSNERKGNDSKENDRIKNDRKGSESKGNERKENERKENDADTRRVRVLAAIRVNNRITTAKIAQFLGCAESTVNRDLSYLREHGNIVRMGGLKFGYWKILKED